MNQPPYQQNGQNNNQIQYQQPMYPAVPSLSYPGKGLCVASLVLGIVSLVLCWFYIIDIAALIIGIVGIVCSVVGRKRAIVAGVRSGIGTAGLVCSIIGLVLAAVVLITYTLYLWIVVRAYKGVYLF